MRQQIERLYRMILLAVGRGRVKTVVDDGNVQFVQVVLGQLETRDKTPRLAEYGFASSPPVDSDAIVLFVAGDRSNGVVVATGHQASRLKNLARGEAAIYDDQGRWIWIKRDSIEIEAGEKPINITNATVVTIEATTKVRLETPKLEVTGEITAGGNITDVVRSMAADRAKYNVHKHTGVTVGGGTSGPTDTPE